MFFLLTYTLATIIKRTKSDAEHKAASPLPATDASVPPFSPLGPTHSTPSTETLSHKKVPVTDVGHKREVKSRTSVEGTAVTNVSGSDGIKVWNYVDGVR
jgi:hypothetical protein